jgi:hypothetical protein
MVALAFTPAVAWWLLLALWVAVVWVAWSWMRGGK